MNSNMKMILQSVVKIIIIGSLSELVVCNRQFYPAPPLPYYQNDGYYYHDSPTYGDPSPYYYNSQNIAPHPTSYSNYYVPSQLFQQNENYRPPQGIYPHVTTNEMSYASSMTPTFQGMNVDYSMMNSNPTYGTKSGLANQRPPYVPQHDTKFYNIIEKEKDFQPYYHDDYNKNYHEDDYDNYNDDDDQGDPCVVTYPYHYFEASRKNPNMFEGNNLKKYSPCYPHFQPDFRNKFFTFKAPITLLPSRFPPRVEEILERIQNYFSTYTQQQGTQGAQKPFNSSSPSSPSTSSSPSSALTSSASSASSASSVSSSSSASSVSSSPSLTTSSFASVSTASSASLDSSASSTSSTSSFSSSSATDMPSTMTTNSESEVAITSQPTDYQHHYNRNKAGENEHSASKVGTPLFNSAEIKLEETETTVNVASGVEQVTEKAKVITTHLENGVVSTTEETHNTKTSRVHEQHSQTPSLVTQEIADATETVSQLNNQPEEGRHHNAQMTSTEAQNHFVDETSTSESSIQQSAKELDQTYDRTTESFHSSEPETVPPVSPVNVDVATEQTENEHPTEEYDLLTTTNEVFTTEKS